MGERRMERETGAGEKKRERETGMGERKIEREEREREREIGRETGVGERERQGRKRRSDRGEREKITNTKKVMQFYLVVLYSAERSEARQWIVHDKCRATIHCRFSIRLPETRWERK